MIYSKKPRRRHARTGLPASGLRGVFIRRLLTTGLLLMSVALFVVTGLLVNVKTAVDVTNCPCLELADRQLDGSSRGQNLNGNYGSRHVTEPTAFENVTTRWTELENNTATKPNKFKPGWWVNHTTSTCLKLGFRTNQTALDPSMLSKVLVDENHKILYCQMAKVASTNLGKIFAIIAGKFNGTNPDVIQSHDIHGMYNKLHTHLDAYPKDVMIDKLKHYYKFVFVRDPFERLLSGYRNKFLKPSSSYFTYLNNRLVLKYRRNSTQAGGVTFQEFVSYLVDKERKVPMNGHWQPMYELCRPCETRYDFVGKVSSLGEDVSHILEVNNLTDILDIPKQSSSHSFHKTDLYLGQYFSQVPRPLLLSLFEMYYPDYAIFDFQIPEVIQKLLDESSQQK